MKRLTLTIKARRNKRTTYQFNVGLVKRIIIRKGKKVIVDKEYQYDEYGVNWGKGGLDLANKKELHQLIKVLQKSSNLHNINTSDWTDMMMYIAQFKLTSSVGTIQNLPSSKYFDYSRERFGRAKRKYKQ